MSAPRVVVFAYGPRGLAALDTLTRLGTPPVAVVVPGNRRHRDVEMVADEARARGYPVLTQPARDALAPFLEELRRLRPDLLLVWSYSMILPSSVIALAPRGAVNVHGGLLPEYRGGHVMQWALINGETETGVTLHYLDAGIDTGPIIARQSFPIDDADDAASVQNKLIATAQATLTVWWPRILDGTAPRVPQDESRARYHRMRSAEDGRIDWTQSNVAIANLVRALVAPWPGAFTALGGGTVVLRRVAAVDAAAAAASGTVVRCGESGVRVAAGRGEVEWLAAEIGGAPATLSDLRRAGLAEGIRL